MQSLVAIITLFTGFSMASDMLPLEIRLNPLVMPFVPPKNTLPPGGMSRMTVSSYFVYRYLSECSYDSQDNQNITIRFHAPKELTAFESSLVQLTIDQCNEKGHAPGAMISVACHKSKPSSMRGLITYINMEENGIIVGGCPQNGKTGRSMQLGDMPWVHTEEDESLA